jgi:L-asparaginase/Glu-tRNA(Gln) amidotransferase subunit D
VAAGARAIVSAALPPGVVTPAETEALLEARKRGVLIVMSSRAGSGRVLPRTVLRRQDLVVADNLTPQKARILAMLALTRTNDPARSSACSTSTRPGHSGPGVRNVPSGQKHTTAISGLKLVTS